MHTQLVLKEFSCQQVEVEGRDCMTRYDGKALIGASFSMCNEIQLFESLKRAHFWRLRLGEIENKTS